jgi:hypothetical protein
VRSSDLLERLRHPHAGLAGLARLEPHPLVEADRTGVLEEHAQHDLFGAHALPAVVLVDLDVKDVGARRRLVELLGPPERPDRLPTYDDARDVLARCLRALGKQALHEPAGGRLLLRHVLLGEGLREAGDHALPVGVECVVG